MPKHQQNAARFLADSARTGWHDETLWMVRKKRDLAAQSVPEWETLRDRASKIKENALQNLDTYLERFETEAKRNGAEVLWASDAKEFNSIILDIIRKHDAKRIVKSKSMLTEECGLNNFLHKHDIEVVDTDLGERIIQFRNETPSHIVLPAIHLKKEEIGETFHEKLGTKKGASDPTYLTHAARQHLRKKFLSSQVAITGVNFAVSETGSVVVCTNEGNADMGVQSAPVQIHCMGIEKIVGRQADLGVFMRLLARNATGQPVTTYISHYMKPKPGGAMYIVIVDNGRSKHLGNGRYVESLKCIRCGGCMNTCPVFRRSGGHSYGYVIPGPIGSVLAPERTGNYADLPFACSLCGSCDDICPVKINLHEQLYRWRQELNESGRTSVVKRFLFRAAGHVLSSRRLYNFAGFVGRKAIGYLPRKLLYMPLNAWGRGRELPIPPEKTFKETYRKKN
jgi:L-lactate dehydrogenase complex protein LldF